MEKISIIIPVYNAEPYINKCLDSIVNQTYKNIEIICVNDGSLDSSGGVCDQYAKKDSRIKVFHKANGGESSARNAGLKIATGKYIGFVDCDDWVEPDMYEVLYNQVTGSNAQISIANFFKNSDIQQIPMQNLNHIPDRNISTKEMMLFALNRDYYAGYCSYIWNKLFDANVIKRNEIQFDENIKLGGDVLFHAQYVLLSESVGLYVDKPLYHYYQRDSSTSHTSDISLKSDIMMAYKKIEELLNERGFSDISFWARGFYCYHASVAAKIALEQNNLDVFSSMQDEIRIHYDDYIRTNESFPEKHEMMQKLMRCRN